MTSPIYIITPSRRQQVLKRLVSAVFIYFAVISPLNPLIKHDKQKKILKCLLISSESGSTRNMSEWLGKQNQSFAVSGLA